MSNIYEGYLRPYGYAELLEDLISFKDIFGKGINVKVIGNSVKGRLLPLIKIGRGQRKLLLIGATHGREFVSTAFIMRSLYELLNSSEELSESCLYIMPMLNPDSVEISLLRDFPVQGDCDRGFFKNNANNINLNANFPYYFAKVPKRRQGGRIAASEPETKALIGLCEKEKFDLAVSLHARGNCIFWRDLGNGEVKGDFLLAQKLSKSCGFELMSPTKYAEDYSGGFENWFRCRFKKPALCVELVKDEDISFSDMCKSFDEAVLWDKTKDFLKSYITFS